MQIADGGCGVAPGGVPPVRSARAIRASRSLPCRVACVAALSNVSRETFSGERLTGGRATGTISSRADEAFPVG